MSTADAAVVAATQDAATPAAYRTALAKDDITQMELDPFRISKELATRLGMKGAQAVPFVPAALAKMSPVQVTALLSRSPIWAHRCTEMYFSAVAAIRNERASLRLAGEHAEQVFFVQHIGHKPVFIFQKMHAQKLTGKIADRALTVAKEAMEDESPELYRFTYPAATGQEAKAALQGIPHIKVSHPKEEVVYAYDVFLTEEKDKERLRSVGLLEEKRALTTTCYEKTQVVLRAKNAVGGAPLAESLNKIARSLAEVAYAMLKPTALHLRFSTPQAMIESMKNFSGESYVKIYYVPPPRDAPTPQIWSPDMVLPEPRMKMYAIKSVRARSDADFARAAERAGVTPVKLISFYLMTVQFPEGATPICIRLADLDPGLSGMVLEPLDLF